MTEDPKADLSFSEYESGRREMAAGNYSKAIKHLQNSIAHTPHFKSLELLGESMLAIGNPSAAIVPLAAAAGLGTNEFRAVYLVSKAYFALGDDPTALRYVERALLMRPDFKRARELRDEINEKLAQRSLSSLPEN